MLDINGLLFAGSLRRYLNPHQGISNEYPQHIFFVEKYLSVYLWFGRLFKGFNHVWSWQPSQIQFPDNFSILEEALNEIQTHATIKLQKKCSLKHFTQYGYGSHLIPNSKLKDLLPKMLHMPS